MPGWAGAEAAATGAGCAAATGAGCTVAGCAASEERGRSAGRGAGSGTSALSVAAGMRQIEPVLIRVGQSFRANSWQMATKVYLPAMRHPIINGVRLGLGVALIGTLLAETKLSNRGIGFLIIQAYSLFDMPRMYAMLIVLFVLSIGANAIVGRLGGLDSIKRF